MNHWLSMEICKVIVGYTILAILGIGLTIILPLLLGGVGMLAWMLCFYVAVAVFTMIALFGFRLIGKE
jgi:hypothetical protein